MKYVVVRNELGEEVPLLFRETINHSTVQKFGRDHESVSAGFALVRDGKWEAFGRSVSLNLKSRPKEDSALLNEHFRECI